MFDVTGDDIAALSDGELRTLVARLAVAEVVAGCGSASGVTAGGLQDAPDGGIDVRVLQNKLHLKSDFVPRAQIGIQVKKPDLAPNSIKAEMRPKGELRASITELLDRQGGYIIASAATLSDSALASRRSAMLQAVSEHPQASSFFVDFYDRSRLATWANIYPGVAAWVLKQVGRELSGWRALGSWNGLSVTEDAGYLCDESLTLIDERAGTKVLPIAEAIETLREALRQPRTCIRLVGLSGVGKTRLVEALFEENVGHNSLDPAIAVYADYSETTLPPAGEMAVRLAGQAQRAILIVDNCNPATHGQVAAICASANSSASLITVEYDVRDDEPEHTHVFRLSAASPQLIELWLEREFSDLSSIDRRRIADFSGGNFRLARVLAGTVGKSDSIGSLRDEQLFERIFQQRKEANSTLLRIARAFSLFYSFDASEESGEELNEISRLSSQSLPDLHEAIAELQERGVLQARGRWRALLPHAVANRLAAGLLERTTSHAIDDFARQLPNRMLVSLTRRVGWLHDSPAAQRMVTRWVQRDGPLGDILQASNLNLLSNLAPAAPEAVLERMETELASPVVLERVALPRSNERPYWVNILKALAFESQLFDRSALLLANIVAAQEPNENYNSASWAFEELFHLYLSGTQASPAQRQAMVRRLIVDQNNRLREVGIVALRALLKEGHFSSSANLDFGARPRDHGWHPSLWEDIYDWYDQAIQIALNDVSDLQVKREILAESLRGLWKYEPCRKRYEGVAKEFLDGGEWPEGWAALRTTLFYNPDMPEDVRELTKALIDQLKPADLVAEARVYVLSGRLGHWDIADAEEGERPGSGWRKADARAKTIGSVMASDPDALRAFLPEALSAGNASRGPQFGVGLAQGAADRGALWQIIYRVFSSIEPAQRDPTVLANFLRGVAPLDQQFVALILDGALTDPILKEHFAFIQVVSGIDERGIDRLVTALTAAPNVTHFQHLARLDVDELAVGKLTQLLDAVSEKPGGVKLALEMLWHRFYRTSKEVDDPAPPELLARGRWLLGQLTYEFSDDLRDYGLGYIVRGCLAGVEGREAARTVCKNIYDHYGPDGGWQISHHEILAALFEVQPEISLDEFLGGRDGPAILMFRSHFDRGSPLSNIAPDILVAWANIDAHRRYRHLSRCLSLFKRDRGDHRVEISPLFLALLEACPDRLAFLGDAYDRLHPTGWSGSLANVLETRKSLLSELPEFAEVQRWKEREIPRVERWIAAERLREGEQEERFE